MHCILTETWKFGTFPRLGAKIYHISLFCALPCTELCHATPSCCSWLNVEWKMWYHISKCMGFIFLVRFYTFDMSRGLRASTLSLQLLPPQPHPRTEQGLGHIELIINETQKIKPYCKAVHYTVLAVNNVAWYISMPDAAWGCFRVEFQPVISTCVWLFRHCDKTFRTQGHRFECLLRQ